MTLEYARDVWRRAQKALSSAEVLLDVSSDDAASRAYYAAFHAVTALFVLRGTSFSKHTAIRAAVHRDLVNAGEWGIDIGEAFDALCELRDMGDYGGEAHADAADAADAVQTARDILEVVRRSHPELET